AGGSLTLETPEGSEIELRIPAAALSSEQEITLRRVAAASWPAETESMPVVGSSVRELLPDGIVFETPVSLIVRHGAAPVSLGTGSRQVIPSHVSRTSAGAMARHPSAVSRRRDGSAATVGRVPHFSAHWTSTRSEQGEYGVD